MEESQRSEGPYLGQIVQSLRGRDAGQYAVIIGVIDDTYILLADGYKRKFDRPKKKNNRHVRYEDDVDQEVANNLRELGRVTNAKLRYALETFHLTRPSCKRKESEL